MNKYTNTGIKSRKILNTTSTFRDGTIKKGGNITSGVHSNEERYKNTSKINNVVYKNGANTYQREDQKRN